MRTEQEIFLDLTQLCLSPGYVHAVAFICFKDNIVRYANEITPEDLLSKYSWDRLIRTEMTTLVGLLLKAEINYELPPTNVVQTYIDDSYRLMEELHESMSRGIFDGLTVERVQEHKYNPFSEGNALREPIFYSGESAYSFQFRDFAVKKYTNDNVWLEQNKGFSIESARNVVLAFCIVQNQNLTNTQDRLKELPPSEWTFLPGFSVTTEQVAAQSGMSESLVRQVLEAFAVPEGERNGEFQSLHDFNIANATPLLRKDGDTFLLFEQYSLVQALYDSPFFWMGADPGYAPIAMQNRGRFTENFAKEKLEKVFGKDRVFPDVIIYESKATQVTDIDVLVLFGNRAIVLQAKSKRLTLEARKGNDGKLKDDFQKSVQDAYDQAFESAKCLTNPKFDLIGADREKLQSPKHLKEIYIFCVVSDFYPALTFQARQFLKHSETSLIRPPIVTDIFALDAMTEMLESPLQFLSYVNRRTNYSEKLYVPDELTALSYHLKCNLWLSDEYNFVRLWDDISCDLDAAMTVRRDNIPGKRTPDGILTKCAGTTLEKILKDIESKPDGRTLDFGFTVLTFNEPTFRRLSDGIDQLAEMTLCDGKQHNFSIGCTPASTGVTVHCNLYPMREAADSLRTHCENRKYMQKADTWFGISIDPQDKTVRFGLELDSKWKKDAQKDQVTRDIFHRLARSEGNIGRNDKCPCGSGLKYKKCGMIQ